MSKAVYLKDSFDFIADGVELLAKGVGSTLGPSGKTVIIHRIGEDPFITKDGVTAANEFDSDHPLIRLGIMLARKVSSKMDTDDGDGTTSTTVVLNALIQNYREHIGAETLPEMYEFQQQIHFLANFLYTELDKRAKVPTIDDLKRIALTSTNHDEILAELFHKAYAKVGFDGYINLANSNNGESKVDIIDGFVLEMGYADRKYANNPVTNFFEAKTARILLYDAEFTDRKQMVDFLSQYLPKGVPVVVIAKNFSSEVVELVDYNNSTAKGTVVCLVKNIYRNDEYDGLVSDIEHYTGAVRTKSFEKFETELGICHDLVIKQGYTIMGKCDETLESSLEDYLHLLTLSAEEEASLFLKEQILKRVSRIKNGVTTVYIGGDSEIEIKERRHRADDAFKACNSAIRNKVIVGGGNTIVNIAKEFKKITETTVSELFFDSVLAPFFLILENSLHSANEQNMIYYQISEKKSTMQEVDVLKIQKKLQYWIL